MIVELTPRIKFVCDRCGKEEYPDKDGILKKPHDIIFNEFNAFKILKKEGQVCESCANEFWEYANNFFDEVNKEGSENEP